MQWNGTEGNGIEWTGNQLVQLLLIKFLQVAQTCKRVSRGHIFCFSHSEVQLENAVELEKTESMWSFTQPFETMIMLSRVLSHKNLSYTLLTNTSRNLKRKPQTYKQSDFVWLGLDMTTE